MTNFKRISRGHKEGYDYKGFGWFIEKGEHWGETLYYVYKAEECRFDADGYVETPFVKGDSFGSLKDAKDWCRANAR